MDLERARKGLQDKERDLLAEMTQHETEAREASPPEVQDYMDQVVSSEAKEEQFQQAGSDWRVLELVRDALRRIDDGTYGICIDCGRRIEDNRLEATPWTPYCADDQNRHDREARLQGAAEPTL